MQYCWLFFVIANYFLVVLKSEDWAPDPIFLEEILSLSTTALNRLRTLQSIIKGDYGVRTLAFSTSGLIEIVSKKIKQWICKSSSKIFLQRLITVGQEVGLPYPYTRTAKASYGREIHRVSLALVEIIPKEAKARQVK